MRTRCFLAILCVLTTVSCATLTKSTEESKEEADFERKKQQDALEQKEEETATNRTLEKLDMLGNIKDSIDSLIDNAPSVASSDNTNNSTTRTIVNSTLPNVALSKESQESNSNQTKEHDSTVDLVSHNPTTEVQDKKFLQEVQYETNVKEVKGQKDILPIKQQHKASLVKPTKIKAQKKLEDKKVILESPDGKETVGGFQAEFVEDTTKQGILKQKHETGNAKNSTGNHSLVSVKNLTNSVLKPGDIEKASSDASDVKKPIRLHYKSEHLKMFFARKNKTKIEKENAALKAKVTVFGADDIDLSTSLPNFRNETPTTDDSTDANLNTEKMKPEFDRLTKMKDYLKTTRKDLNFRSFIPKRPKQERASKRLSIKKPKHGKTNLSSNDNTTNQTTERKMKIAKTTDGIDVKKDTTTTDNEIDTTNDDERVIESHDKNV